MAAYWKDSDRTHAIETAREKAARYNRPYYAYWACDGKWHVGRRVPMGIVGKMYLAEHVRKLTANLQGTSYCYDLQGRIC